MTSTLVTKTSTSTSLRGELHFYRSIPLSLQSYFPTLRSFTTHPLSLTIDHVSGPTLSNLLVDGQLTVDLIKTLLHTLHTLHTSGQPPIHTTLLYANHFQKVSRRFNDHLSLYNMLGLSLTHFQTLLPLLRNFEQERRAFPAAVVHGDPVLTNVLVPEDDVSTSTSSSLPINSSSSSSPTKGHHVPHLKLIDMRGAQGEVLTLIGDATYDLSKVLQSLLGYDFVLADASMNSNAILTQRTLLTTFWKEVALLYPQIKREDVVLGTCALYSSLIPLHDNVAHRIAFAKIARVLLQALVDGTVGKARVDLVSRIAEELGGRS